MTDSGVKRALSNAPRLRAVARAVVPLPIRGHVHRILDQPFLVTDFLPDVFDRFGLLGAPLPPPRLRARVSRTSSRDEFRRAGRNGAACVEEAFLAARDSSRSYASWLDFGCGSGRYARYLTEEPGRLLTGVDVDEAAIAWARDHLSGTYLTIPRQPPTSLPTAAFDVVLAVSVFTHLCEREELSWLTELSRVLRPGGLLIASTFGPNLVYLVPNVTADQTAALSRDGYLYFEGEGGFNSNAAFHHGASLEKRWAPWFALRSFEPAGLSGFQDLAVWTRKANPEGRPAG